MLNEKSSTNVEITEDVFGEEVYYSYLKMGRKLIDDNDLDNERM